MDKPKTPQDQNKGKGKERAATPPPKGAPPKPGQR